MIRRPKRLSALQARYYSRLMQDWDNLSPRERWWLAAAADRLLYLGCYGRDITKNTNPHWRSPGPVDPAAALACLRELKTNLDCP